MRIAQGGVVVNGAGEGAVDQGPHALRHFRTAPHNLEAEQALLGAILVTNEAQDRVSGFLEPHHFFDPLHQQIYETAAQVIASGKQATPITLKTFFENAEPIGSGLSVPAYLGQLAANATTIINVPDYGRTIRDLWARRQLILIGEDMVNAAYDTPVDFPPAEQMAEARTRIASVSAVLAADAAPVYEARRLADIAAEHIRWLWPQRLALGKLSLVAGQPGLGKSQLTLAMAAAVTTGRDWPDGTRAPLGSAVLVSCEDDAADTIRPRLEAAGADLRRIHIFDWTISRDKRGGTARLSFDVAEHVPSLAAFLARIGDTRLIVIDPITAYMGSADSHKTADVRSALVPLQGLVAQAGAAGLLVSHLNKASEGAAMNRVVGSGAFVAVCRSSWLVATDPQDGERQRRIMTPLKNNIGDDRTGFAFTVEPHYLPDGIATSRIVFDPNPLTVDANDLLRDTASRGGGDDGGLGPALIKACYFLRNALEGGARRTTEVQADADANGLAWRTVESAKKQLGVISTRLDGHWWMRLPSPPQSEE
jgi:hypothetical protein